MTGANGGIGQAICSLFSDRGYRVIATDIQLMANDKTLCHAYLSLDLVKFVQDEMIAKQFFERLFEIIGEGCLCTLINNAAIQILGGVDSLDRTQWQTTLDVNLSAPFFMAQGLLGGLEKHKGSIVNVSSIHAKLTKKNFVAYATSKAALSGMTRSMAVDLGNRVRVNAIEPAAIETDMLRDGFKDNPAGYVQLANCHPQQCIGKPKEVAELVLYLSQTDSSFLHGACIGLDGGIAGRLYDYS